VTIRDKTAIVGVGATPYYRRGESYPQTELEMACRAILLALEDAGLTVADVDGFALFAYGYDPAQVAATLGAVREHGFQLRAHLGQAGLLGRHPVAHRFEATAFRGAAAPCVVRVDGVGDLVECHAEPLEMAGEPDPRDGVLGVDAVARRQPPGRAQEAAALVVAHGVDADPGLSGHGPDQQRLTLDHGPEFTVGA